MKRILSLVLVGALSGGALWAADPWKSNKKYTEWSEKEIRKVLQKSPWAKTVTLTLPIGVGFGPGAGDGRQPGGYERRSRAGAGGPTGAGGPGAPGGGGFGGPGGGGLGGPSAHGGGVGAGGSYPRARSRYLELLVRWHSALPVRQAYTRQQVAAEQMTPEHAEQLIQETPNQYVVMVSGMPMAAMGGTTPEKVKASSYLKTGRGQRIMVQDVRMSRGQGQDAPTFQDRISNLYFFFPRATPIELSHKSVEFVTELGRHKIKKKFKLKKMLFEGKLEL